MSEHMARRSLMKLNRLEAFSDGVFSIAATLLVLEFRVPNLHGMSAHQVDHVLAAFGGPMLAYVTSFCVIGVVWLNHHPEMLADYSSIPQVAMFYGLAQAATGIAFNVLNFYVVRRYRAQAQRMMSHRTLLATRLFGIAYPAVSLVGAGLAYVNPAISVVIYVVLPIVYLMPNAVEWTLTRGEAAGPWT
jgi:hypothetical protein